MSDYSLLSVVAVAAVIADQCWVSFDRGHHGHILSTQTHGFGATYLDGYGEGLEKSYDGDRTIN